MQTHPHSNPPPQWWQLYTLSHLSTAPSTLAEQKPRPKTPLQQMSPSRHYYKMVTPFVADLTHPHSNFFYQNSHPPPWPNICHCQCKKYSPVSYTLPTRQLPWPILSHCTHSPLQNCQNAKHQIKAQSQDFEPSFHLT
jgi:hypothetical protein